MNAIKNSDLKNLREYLYAKLVFPNSYVSLLHGRFLNDRLTAELTFCGIIAQICN